MCVFLVSMQSSLWFHFFGYFPSPQLWALPLTYWTIYRKPLDGLVMVYAISIISSSQTATSLNMLLFIFLILFAIGIIIKQRIFWTGSTYFIAASGLATILFPLVHFILSYFSDSNPISSFEFFSWIISSLLTILFALPIYTLFKWIDALTNMELPTETGSSIYE